MPAVKVAFQGARGAFSEGACERILPDRELEYKPCERFFEVFAALGEGSVDYAVVPIENTLHGSIHENYDHLLHCKPTILAETHVRIVHNLIGRPEATLGADQCATSHPVALAKSLDLLPAPPQPSGPGPPRHGRQREDGDGRQGSKPRGSRIGGGRAVLRR